MNQALADNIRTLRTKNSWTQEQLAEAARVNLRTVQRAEAAQGASAETLLAFAGALNIDVTLLRFDRMAFLAREFGVSKEALTPEFLAERQKQIDATHTTVRLTRMTASADLRPLSEAQGVFFECASKNDDIQDVAAAFQLELNDLMDAGGDIDATFRRKCEVDAFEHVRSLEKLGAAVSVGLHRHRMAIANHEAVPWTTLYVIVAMETEVKEFVMIPRNRAVRFA